MSIRTGRFFYFPIFLFSLIFFVTLAGMSFGESPTKAPSSLDREAVAPFFSVTFIDVGQGDAILLRSGGKNVLIDAGDDGKDAGKVILAFLKKKQIKKIDTAVITHPHRDHFGGFLELVAKFPIGEFIYSTDSLANIQRPGTPGTLGDKTVLNDLVAAIHKKEIPYHQAHYGDAFNWGNIKVEILHTSEGVLDEPTTDPYPPTANDYSLVFKVTAGNVSYMLTGDLEERGEAAMEAKWGSILKSNVLKAGHHGSKSSSSQKFLNAVSPESAVISVGLNNQFKHPSASTLLAYQAMNITTFRTDQSGTVSSTTDGKTVDFAVEHSGSLRDLVASADKLGTLADMELAAIRFETLRGLVLERVRSDLSTGDTDEIGELFDARQGTAAENIKHQIRDLLIFNRLHQEPYSR
jgi:competence protein ComEC